jgi:hypothetical protein
MSLSSEGVRRRWRGEQRRSENSLGDLFLSDSLELDEFP